MKYVEVGAVKVNRYDMLCDDEKHRIFEMIVRYLYRTGLTDAVGRKADFYRACFSGVWDFVKRNPEQNEYWLSRIP